MSFSDYLETKVLDHVFAGVAYTAPGTHYVALFTAAPSDSGGGTEVSGGAYARQTIAFHNVWRHNVKQCGGRVSDSHGQLRHGYACGHL